MTGAHRKEPSAGAIAGLLAFVAALRGAFVRLLALRNLRADRFATFAAVVGVALGTATVDVVLVLDANTRRIEAKSWATNPSLDVDARRTVKITGVTASGEVVRAEDAKEETHEDYEVMRSAIRLGSLSAFLVGALIVFFTFGVVVERRKREIALLRSLGAERRQVAAVFVREAAIIGIAGALLGLALAVPMAYVAARAGITTTGRSEIRWTSLGFPKKVMLVVSAVGAATAVLGVLRPALAALRLDVARTLRPRFLEGDLAAARAAGRRRATSMSLVALPLMSLVYVLMRPFFRDALPSLTFFVIEAGLACVAFLATLVLVPDLVRHLGGLAARLVPSRRSAEGLLARRRIEHAGDELAWSVSGVMLVFALLLGLHVATHALEREVVDWAGEAIRPHAYVYATEPGDSVEPVVASLPDTVVRLRFTGRTPWPNAIHAVRADELVRFAETSGRPEAIRAASRLTPGTILLSKLMARRFGVGEGDLLEISGEGGTARLRVVAVTDAIGYVPAVGPYRNGKTYGVIEASDGHLIAPYAAPLGAAIALAAPAGPSGIPDWRSLLEGVPRRLRGIHVATGTELERARVTATARDFVIFDVILGLTTVLAAIGMANQMMLAVHARRRELSLYRVLGMTRAQVRRMVVIEGAFIGLLGGALAALLGVPLGYAAIGALRAVSAFDVSFAMPPWYPPAVALGATAVSIAASVVPAARAAAVDSAESVHYE